MSSVPVSEADPASPQQQEPEQKQEPPSRPPRKDHLRIYRANRARLYPSISDEQWNDWKWQQKNRVTSLEQITSLFSVDEFSSARLTEIFELYRTAITPYYLCLIDFDDPQDPLRAQSVPSVDEM